VTGGFFAVFLVIYLGFWFLNSLAEWITNEHANNMLDFIRDAAILTVVGLFGLEFVLGRRRNKFWLFFVYLALLAAAVVFMILFHMDIRFIGDEAVSGILPLI